VVQSSIPNFSRHLRCHHCLDDRLVAGNTGRGVLPHHRPLSPRWKRRHGLRQCGGDCWCIPAVWHAMVVHGGTHRLGQSRTQTGLLAWRRSNYSFYLLYIEWDDPRGIQARHPQRSLYDRDDCSALAGGFALPRFACQDAVCARSGCQPEARIVTIVPITNLVVIEKSPH